MAAHYKGVYHGKFCFVTAKRAGVLQLAINECYVARFLGFVLDFIRRKEENLVVSSGFELLTQRVVIAESVTH